MTTPQNSLRNLVIGWLPIVGAGYFRFLADLPLHWDWRIGAAVVLAFTFPFHNLSPAAIATTPTRATALWVLADRPMVRAASLGPWMLLRGDIGAAQAMRAASIGWIVAVALVVV